MMMIIVVVVVVVVSIVVMFVGHCRSTGHSWQSSGVRITASSLKVPFILLMRCL
jgi:hypothetical protein